jgi:Tol biopolymer transport system component
MRLQQFIQNKLARVIGLTALLLMLSTVLTAQEKIAFETLRDGNFEIYVMNADGSNPVNLTNSAGDDLDPAFSPDGSRIAFTSSRDGNFEIYVMNADGTNQTRLTMKTAAGEGEVAWSPDGKKLAFTSGRDGNNEIYVMNADGTNQVNLTNNAAQDQEAAFSPDGSRIAFHSFRTGDGAEIFVMNANGTNPVNLTNTIGNDTEPVWHPSGNKIAFRALRNGTIDIYLMNPDGSGQLDITPNTPSSFESQPVYNHDGTKLAFRSNRDGNNEVYVMNQDGTSQVNLSNNASYDDEPSFGVAPVQSPTDFRVDSVSATQVRLAWTDNATNEDGFVIERCTGAGCTDFVEIGRANPDDTIYADDTVAKNTQYSYRMRAYNSTNASPYTNVLTVKTLKR